MTSADFSWFIITTVLAAHETSRDKSSVFPCQLPDLPAWITIAFWTSLLLASLSSMQALVSGFCPSGSAYSFDCYDNHIIEPIFE